MWRRIAVVALSLVLIGLYRYVLVLAFGYSGAVGIPHWWRATFGPGHDAAWAWVQTLDTLVTLLATIPFAVLVARIFARRWMLVSLLAAGFAVAADLIAIP